MLQRLYSLSIRKLRSLISGTNSTAQFESKKPHTARSELTKNITLPPSSTSAEKALIKWNQGDHLDLVDIRVADLNDHPDRARLALAFGSANQNLGNAAVAREFIRHAKQWGCDKKFISQFLIADTYKTLARANNLMREKQEQISKASDTSEKTLFEEKNKLPSSIIAELRKTLPENSRDKISQTEWQTDLANQISEEYKEFKAKLYPAIDLQNQKISGISNEIKNELKNFSKQLESVIKIQLYLTSGKILPPFHGWPVSPDFAYLLLQKIETHKYDMVIEFGSGTSTALIAEGLGRAYNQDYRPRQIAFEHLEKYYVETSNLIKNFTQSYKVDLVLAPLKPLSIAESTGRLYNFYDCQAKLLELASDTRLNGGKLLVVIDGPPGSTGPHARYPSLPTILEKFSSAAIDFLLDDTNRIDEQEIVEMWKNILRDINRSYKITKYDFEKGAILLEVEQAISQAKNN